MIMAKAYSSEISELYKQLRNNIIFNGDNKNVKSILITGDKKAEGKSRVACNLALSIANLGKKTLLIDCNLNQEKRDTIELPEQDICISISPKRVDKSSGIFETQIENLNFFSCPGARRDSPDDVMLCKELDDLMNKEKDQYEYIILDAPSIQEASYVQLLSRIADGCLLVISSGLSQRKEILKTKELLENANAKILGTVMNQADEDLLKKDYHKKNYKAKGEVKLKSWNPLLNFINMFKKPSLKAKNIHINMVLAFFLAASLVINPFFPLKVAEAKNENPAQPIINISDYNNQGLKITVTPEEGDKGTVEVFARQEDTWNAIVESSPVEGKSEIILYYKDAGAESSQGVQTNFTAGNYNLYVTYKSDKENRDVTKAANSTDSQVTPTAAPDNNDEGTSIELTASTDYRNFPIQAKVGSPLNVQASSADNSAIAIIGSGNRVLKTLNDGSWTPEERGIFWLAAVKGSPNEGNSISDNSIINKRKVYVNSREYYQITDLSLSESTSEDNNTSLEVRSDRFIINSISSYSPADTHVKVNIGDPHVWNKNIITENINKEFNKYLIGKNYTFNYGNYYVQASLKNPNSIEYEDAVGKLYKQRGLEDLNFSVAASVNDALVNNLANAYPAGTKFTFSASASKASGNTPQLQYIYLIKDKKGIHPVTDYINGNDDDFISDYMTGDSDYSYGNYTNSAEYTWQPSNPGDYTIYARVRQANKPSDNPNQEIPNSYEKEIQIPITIAGPQGAPLSITDTRVYDISSNSRTGDGVPLQGSQLKTHNLYQLEVDIDRINIPEGSLVEYKAYAIHDGVVEALCDFNGSNLIPFFPKSFENYTIEVMAKYSGAGASQASGTYTFTVDQ